MSQLSLLVKDATAFWSSSQKSKRVSLPFFFYLLFILFLPTQLGKHFWLDASYVLGLRVDYLSPTFYLTDLLLIITALAVVFQKRSTLSFHFSFPRLVSFAVALFLISVLISLLTVPRPILVMYGLLKIVEMGVVVFCTFYFLRIVRKRVLVSLVFSLGLVFESFLALLQFLSQSSIDGVLYFVGERSFTILTPGIAVADIGGQLLLRPYGTLPHPNVLAGFLLVGSIFLFVAYKTDTSRFVKRFLAIVWVLSGLALFLTLSRTGIVLAACMLGFVLFHSVLTKQSVKLSRLFIIGGTGIGILLSPLIFKRFQELTVASESVTQRLSLLESSYQMIVESLLIGVGLNHFLVSLPSYLDDPATVFFLQPVHNMYLLVLAETGLVGLSGFLLFLAFLFTRLRKSNGSEKLLGSMLLSVILLVGFVDHYFLTLQQGQLLFAFVIGYILAISHSSPVKQT